MVFAAKVPSDWTWCKKAETFCLSSSQSCDPTSKCGDQIRTAEECKKAAIELRVLSVLTVINHKPAPAGCFVDDQARAFFNNETQAGSDYSFLKSMCRLKIVSSLPEAKNESITACGKNRTLLVYEIAAEDLERTINVLLSKHVTHFALRLAQGTARLKSRLTLQTKDTNTWLDIVIAGQFPQGWMGMSQPPLAGQLTTRIDLAAQSVFISGGREDVVCLQDLHFSNGKVETMTCNQQSARRIVCCAGQRGRSSSGTGAHGTPH